MFQRGPDPRDTKQPRLFFWLKVLGAKVKQGLAPKGNPADQAPRLFILRLHNENPNLETPNRHDQFFRRKVLGAKVKQGLAPIWERKTRANLHRHLINSSSHSMALAEL